MQSKKGRSKRGTRPSSSKPSGATVPEPRRRPARLAGRDTAGRSGFGCPTRDLRSKSAERSGAERRTRVRLRPELPERLERFERLDASTFPAQESGGGEVDKAGDESGDGASETSEASIAAVDSRTSEDGVSEEDMVLGKTTSDRYVWTSEIRPTNVRRSYHTIIMPDLIPSCKIKYNSPIFAHACHILRDFGDF